jgi:hypothetical protein
VDESTISEEPAAVEEKINEESGRLKETFSALSKKPHSCADFGSDSASASASPTPTTGDPIAASTSNVRSASIAARRRASTSHYRRPSVSVADILTSANKTPLSPTDVPDIYRRQAETISTLTEENEKLSQEIERLLSKEKKLGEVEVENEKLQEQFAEVREELRGIKSRIEGTEVAKKTADEELEKLV